MSGPAMGAAADAKPILALSGVGKRFLAVQALEGVSFDVLPGEIHALVGENGAGKSTLIKILAGNLRADSGRMTFKGRAIDFHSPADSRAAGIGVIYQELTVIRHLSVAENIFLGRLPASRLGFVDRRALRRNALGILGQLGLDIDPGQPAGGLAIGLQQMVEIAKCLAAEADLIIMDEPTSSLGHHEAERLWAVARQLRGQGRTIIFVSHKMDEVFQLADRVTVLRDGAKIATRPVGELTPDRLVALMVGRDLPRTRRPGRRPIGRPALEVAGLARRGRFADISFVAGAGEIVGLAGLIGAGRTDVARAIFGADRPDAGRILVDGARLEPGDPRRAIRAGIGFVPENRKEQALFLQMSVQENICLPARHASRLGVIDGRAEIGVARDFVGRLRIVAASLDQSVASLSGGNQQKVVLARWLAVRPKVLIVDEPTRGIDVAAKAEIHDLLRTLAGQGMAVVVVSSELPEILALSDRILVMRGGRIVAEAAADAASEEMIGGQAVGF